MAYTAPSTTADQFVTAAAAGYDDYTFIRRLRLLLRDFPKPADEQINGAGGTVTKYVVQGPINDDQYLSITVGGAAQTLIFNPLTALGTGQVFVDLDSGFLIFGTAPPSGTNNIYVSKTKVQWRDSQLLEALHAGLRALYPRIWQYGIDTSIIMAVNQWDYQLPAVFSDDQVRLVACGMQEIPAATQRFKPILGAYRVGTSSIHIPASQSWTPGSTLRIEYLGPYRSLAELPAYAIDLPIFYAAAHLLGFNEPKRLRTDQQHTQTGEDASPPGQQMQSGSWFYARFSDELRRRSKPFPTNRIIPTWKK